MKQIIGLRLESTKSHNKKIRFFKFKIRKIIHVSDISAKIVPYGG